LQNKLENLLTKNTAMPSIVRGEDNTLDWPFLLSSGGRRKAEQFLSNTDSFITQTEAPNIKKERKRLGLFPATNGRRWPLAGR
jgi:hypothetical protein